MTSTDLDRAVALLAAGQHGAFTARQVTHLGGTKSTVRTRLANGRWSRLDHGVYALADVPATWHRALMAAVLAEKVAGVSGRPAAALQTFLSYPQTKPEITVPPNANARSRLAIVHRRRIFEHTIVAGIPCGTVTQTIVDLASDAERERLARAVDELLAERRTTVFDLQQMLASVEPVRPAGIGLLRTIVGERGDGYTPPTSELEALLYPLLDDPRIPGWVRQCPAPWTAGGREKVDAYIPAWGLIVEGDGRRWHTRLLDFERDRARDNLAISHGLHTLRFTYRQLKNHPDDVLALILTTGATLSSQLPPPLAAARPA